MSQYINSLGADVIVPKDIDLTASIKTTTQQLFDGYQQLRKDIWSVTPTKDQEVLLKALAVDLDNWRDRLLTFLEPWSTSWYDKLWLIGWVTSKVMLESDQKVVYIGLKRFQTELSSMGDRYKTITGKAKPTSTEPAPEPGPTPGPIDDITDFLWSTVKIGAVGLGLWYGIPYLFKYLDEQSKYPADRLPRYAGGRRRATKRRKTTKKRRR